jgi:hypothetical protein
VIAVGNPCQRLLEKRHQSRLASLRQRQLRNVIAVDVKQVNSENKCQGAQGGSLCGHGSRETSRG